MPVKLGKKFYYNKEKKSIHRDHGTLLNRNQEYSMAVFTRLMLAGDNHKWVWYHLTIIFPFHSNTIFSTALNSQPPQNVSNDLHGTILHLA